MLKCPKCKKVTKKGEPTGSFRVLVYKNPENKLLGTKIFSSIKTCMSCAGEVLK